MTTGVNDGKGRRRESGKRKRGKRATPGEDSEKGLQEKITGNKEGRPPEKKTGKKREGRKAERCKGAEQRGTITGRDGRER